MNAITRTIYLYAKAPNYGTQIDYWASDSANLDLQIFGRVVAQAAVTFDVPVGLNPVQMAIEELEAEKAKVADDFRRTMAGINDRLSKLQAITNEVDE
jgi:hypothetical protein